MKKYGFRAIAAIMLVFIFLLSGCQLKLPFGPDPAGSNNDSTSSDPSGDASGDASAESEIPGSPVECNWTLYVDQTIPVTTDGMTVDYTLLLVAQKTGGKDVYGTYTGACYLGVKFDASQMNNSVMQLLGGFNVDAYSYDLSFDVISYDIEAYSDYGLKDGEAPIAPLVSYESMALLTPEMTGSGSLNPSIDGIQGEHAEINESASGTETIPMKITINSGQVSVYIPSLQISHSFKGTLTGEPLTDADADYDAMMTEAVDKIDAILQEEAAAEAEDGEDSGGLGELGELGELFSQFAGG